MIYLITGSAGFTGKRLIKKLLKNKNNYIYALDLNHSGLKNKNLIEFKIDLRKIRKLKLILQKIKKIDYVIHTMALQPINAKMKLENYLLSNFITATNLLNSINDFNIKRIIVCSSFSVYGKPTKNPISENLSPKPLNYYGFSKLLMEKSFEYFSYINKIKVIVLRFDGIYGSNQNLPGFINMAIQTLKNNEDLIIFNKGKQLRNQVYIDDVVQSIKLSIKSKLKENYNVYNIAGEKPISNKNLSYSLKDILKSKSRIILSNQGNPLRNYDIYMSIKKSNKFLNYKPSPTVNNLKKMLKELRNINEKK